MRPSVAASPFHFTNGDILVAPTLSIPNPVLAQKPAGYFKDGPNDRLLAMDDGDKELLDSIIANGVLQSVGAVDFGEYGELIWGFRRVGLCRYGLSQNLAIPEKIPVQLYPSTLIATHRRVLRATENLQRKDLTDPQTFKLCKELMELNPDWARQDLASHLNKSPSMVTHYLSPELLIPDALQAFLSGKFGFRKAYAISKTLDQHAALAEILNGSGRLPRIKIPLAGDTGSGIVTIAGDNIDLDDAETLLKEALKAVRAAREKKLDTKTAQAVWKNMAKAS
jgi:hypothetical protein